MNTLLLDSFAWLEILSGSERGRKALEIIKKIKENCKILDIDERIALEGGRVKLQNRRMGAVDCLLLATARVKRLKILSGDEHFKGLKDVVLI